MQDALTTAIEMHRTGQLGPAAQWYQKALAREQENADALHLLGVLRHQQGDHARAVELIGRAVALRPNAFAFHANLAEAYRAQGKFDRAIGCCRAALALCPDYPEALCNLGAALQGLNRHGEAVEHFRRALELSPDFVMAHNNLGIALREQSQSDEALVHFQRAVDLEPGFAPAQSNLGQLLLSRGEAEAALVHCQEAVRLQPDTASLHHNLGNVLRMLARYVDARAAYLEALRIDPNLALAQAHLGLIMQREGKLGDALPWLKRATELEPANASFWEWLAELYDELEEPSDSIPCWERVLALGEERSGPHIALGWALQEEGRLDEAAAHYHAALELQPDAAMAHLNLGGLHEELGDLAAAEAALRTALKVQPTFALPHGRLATLLRGKLPDDDLAALEQRLADDGLGQGPRARLLYGLAQSLDARGDFARAADCLRQANALTLELNRDRREYSPQDHEQFVDMLVRQFDRDFFQRLAGAGSPSQRPVFVFGLPRSGTTLTEQVLASHSRVHGAGELRLVRQSFEALPAAVGLAQLPRDCVPHLDATATLGIARQHLERLAKLDGGHAERIVDKMPDNYMYLGFLAALFPQAVFVHCRRDLRDIAVSCWMTDFRSIRWANDPQHIASRFGQYRRLTDHWRAVLPVPIVEVDYEETVDDLESVARRLVVACGLEWEPACLDFHRTVRPIRTASVTQVRQPVYKQSVARWKKYEPAMADLFAALPVNESPSSTT
ncbi:MAG TPA: tetratricopeptide repeat protein [Pirellulales bacterium]|jgi:tetratricopeptide (TPR) repeat protein|nr:tetratricopeptide repeat protein [Pirellulales bacterium]